jgi:formyl-CoA transferase
MHLGDTANATAAHNGKPLDGVRILAAEQMQALPYATQLLGRLGATVVKVEHPTGGESGRASLPGMNDPEGRNVGATFLRNNLNKQSVALDLKHPKGKELFIELAGRFDVVGENFKAGTMDRLGLGYDVLSARHPALIWVSVSGFGNTGLADGSPSPYQAWPAYAMVPEAMSGIYQFASPPGQPPRVNPMGAVGDISSALFATIGILAALRHRDATGKGQQIDIAMFDSMVAMSDIVPNFWSLGQRKGTLSGIMTSFMASDGYFSVQCAREQQFAKLCELIGTPEWLEDPRLATRDQWFAELDTIIRPKIEGWAADKTRLECCDAFGRAGIAAGPCFTPEEVVNDPHVAGRNMLVEMPRSDDGPDPVLVPGNPVKMSGVAEGPEARVPWLGEHTDAVLSQELGLSADQLAELRNEGVIG